ncbi:DNA primase [Marichromatium bheemlicum]|uniref:DNA primase n=1 Tax=Marichromatium bheemlicum TaxID=365339 RepID=A0ABX1IAW1_9GAMM|nr:DNA primase [Marichromatium bheemlicum]NKN34674.1 DNA primase [Marichromatium bheemlicum]
MAGKIPPEFIDDLLTRVDIVDVIGARVQLRKAGKEFQARCPFHEEKTPSFTVSPAKQFYHCFGCGAHGTAIGFLMEHDGLPFREAVDELARLVGVEVPVEGGEQIRGPDHGPLFALLDEADALFRRQLREHPQAARAVEYLKSRGLSGEIAARYGVGFAPAGRDFLLSRLGRTPERCRQLVECGLIGEQDGRRYDRFRDRVMFPIRDRRGRVIGFGGRILGDGRPKYLNSPETPLFHKGRELYGLFEAQRGVRRGLERVLVVEGYLDVIALAQHGIDCAVATLGTATTADHLQRLARTAPELVFCFDGDRAGRDAAWKALETALPLAGGGQVQRFLFLPEGEDPDTLVRQEGRAGFLARVEQAVPLSQFLFDQLTAQVDMTTIDGRARLAPLARPLIERVPAGVFRDLLEQQLARLMGLERRLMRPAAPARAPRQGGALEQQRPSRIAWAIALLLDYPRLAERVDGLAKEWRHASNQGVGILVELLETIRQHPTLSKAALIERWRDHPHFDYLQRLSVHPFLRDITEEGAAAEFDGALERLSAEVRKREWLRSLDDKWRARATRGPDDPRVRRRDT